MIFIVKIGKQIMELLCIYCFIGPSQNLMLNLKSMSKFITLKSHTSQLRLMYSLFSYLNLDVLHSMFGSDGEVSYSICLYSYSVLLCPLATIHSFALLRHYSTCLCFL